jgi:hypothetical protein
LLKLALKRVGTAVYGLSTPDTGGRIAAKAIMTLDEVVAQVFNEAWGADG